MNEDEIRQQAAEVHQHNTQKVTDLIMKDGDLGNLHTVLDATTAEVYRGVLPRYAQLCELDQCRGLTEAERGELAVKYASLYAAFGDEGTVKVAAAWLATRPMRQARGS